MGWAQSDKGSAKRDGRGQDRFSIPAKDFWKSGFVATEAEHAVVATSVVILLLTRRELRVYRVSLPLFTAYYFSKRLGPPSFGERFFSLRANVAQKSQITRHFSITFTSNIFLELEFRSSKLFPNLAKKIYIYIILIFIRLLEVYSSRKTFLSYLLTRKYYFATSNIFAFKKQSTPN